MSTVTFVQAQQPTARRRYWRLAAGVIPAVVVAAVVSAQWVGGWLHLLDWSPGPQPGPFRVELPSGPVVSFFHWLPGVLGSNWSWIPVLGAVVAAGVGAALTSLVWDLSGRRTHPAGVAVTTVVAVVNPFVAARVFTGQVGVLWGYAALWLLVAAVLWSYKRGGVSWLLPAAAWTFAIAATAQMAAIAGVVVACGMMLRARRISAVSAWKWGARISAVTAATTVLWLVSAGREVWSDAAAGGAAAANVFTSGGPLWSLPLRVLGGAGFWRPMPTDSLVVFGVVVAAAWVAALASARWGAGHSRDGRDLFAVSAVVGAVLAVSGRTTVGSLWLSAVDTVPGMGLFREPGKWAMLCLMFPAAGAGATVSRMLLSVRRGRRRGVVGAAVLVVASIGPALVWGNFVDDTSLTTNDFPESWYSVDAQTAARQDLCGVVLVGPGAYVLAEFTAPRVVANPMPTFFGEGFTSSRDARVPGIPQRPARTPQETWLDTFNTTYTPGSPSLTAERLTAQSTIDAGIGWLLADQLTQRPLLENDLEQQGFIKVLDTGDLGLWEVPGGCATTSRGGS